MNMKNIMNNVMPYVDKVKNTVTPLVKKGKQEALKMNNKTLHDAIVSACAFTLASRSWGDSSNLVPADAELGKLYVAVSMIDEVNVFDEEATKTRLEEYLNKFKIDFNIAITGVLATIGKIKSEERNAKLIIRIASDVGGAEKPLDDNGEKSLRIMRQELGIKADDEE